MPCDGDEIEVIRAQIENLRPKLLDFTRRNPLVHLLPKPRSNAHVWVVDELPDVLFFNLSQGQSMCFASLPPLEKEPADEKTEEFQQAYLLARETDEQFAKEIAEAERRTEPDIDKILKLERALKDRVREALALPERQGKTDTNLAVHARLHGITPGFDLPLPEEASEDGRHDDVLIQTLQLPDALERKLNGIVAKEKSFEQETGISVLKAAFGFLEWSEPNSSQANLSPIILLPVRISKSKTREGAEFWITGASEEPELNPVIAEWFRRDFSIELPVYTGGSIESYLSDLSQLTPANMKWAVKRRVAFGVFPSARMAMYHDLDTGKNREFDNNDVVHSLLGGGGEVDPVARFAGEYEIDRPEIEDKVPCLVMDADSSQFSALVDVANGKNLAIEGPPGTGKSQTIVNMIAAALFEGKKVLFIAEKAAALDVVRSRLEAVDLGEFVLPLIAGRTTREQVIESIRERVDMESGPKPTDISLEIARFERAREQIGAYLELMNQTVGETGLTVYQLLGKDIALSERLQDLPDSIKRATLAPDLEYRKEDIAELIEIAGRMEAADVERLAASPNWSHVGVTYLSKFEAEGIQDKAQEAAVGFEKLVELRTALESVGLASDIGTNETRVYLTYLVSVLNHADLVGTETLSKLTRVADPSAVSRFLNECASCQNEMDALSQLVRDPHAPGSVEQLETLIDICGGGAFETLDVGAERARVEKTVAALNILDMVADRVEEFCKYEPRAIGWTFRDLQKARTIISRYPDEVLYLRDTLAASDHSSSMIKQAVSSGAQLAKERAALSEHFVLRAIDSEISHSEVVDTIRIFRNAGILSFFSSGYRSAKRRYKLISAKSKYKKDVAVDDLSILADHMSEVGAFNAKPATKTVFGHHLDGLRTNFGWFGKLADFLADCEEAFPTLEQIALKQFLRSAPLQIVRAIPDLSGASVPNKLNSVRAYCVNTREKTDASLRSIDSLNRLTELFVKPSEINVEDLPEISERLAELNSRSEACQFASTPIEVLGKHFAGWQTTIEPFFSILEAVGQLKVTGADRSSLASVIEGGNSQRAVAALEAIIEADDIASSRLDSLCQASRSSREDVVSNRTEHELATYLRSAAADAIGLHAITRCNAQRAELTDRQFDWLVDDYQSERGELSGLSAVMEAIIYRSLARKISASHEALFRTYHGAKLNELRAQIASADRKIIELNRRRLRRQVKDRAAPPWGVQSARKSELTQMSLLHNEIEKKQRFIAVRDLTRRAGRALQELKPCWMMSPLAVAQYIKPGALTFDLCIIDEASQMPPEDALGGIVRSKQAVVVGDTKQLPPTGFFRKLLDYDGDGEDEEEDLQVLDESILERANSVFRPARRLRWHYRSQHSGLISFSNHFMYNGDLVVFPSATENLIGRGVNYVQVEGNYATGLNTEESKAVSRAAIEFMHNDPNRSLGIVALNQKQAEFIRQEMEFALQFDSKAAEYVAIWDEHKEGLERFFVKNLENVQGDERDVIFISTVYGPTTRGGPVQNRFGPVNGAAGPRRLNVLFSRAKQQIVTFSSMNAEDIKATEGDGSRGAYLLKRWLQYSATGVLEAGETDRNREPDSEFERYVIEQVEAMGCEAVPQVGVAGYFIDIGVRHAEWPHGFVLGVECDGAAYHSAKSARDRDRLRQEVLEGLGWRLFRIWSTDWFENPPREAAKLRGAIYARLAELKAREQNYLRPVPPTPTETTPSPSPDQASKPESKPAWGRKKGLVSEGLKGSDQKTLPFPEKSPPKKPIIPEAVPTRRGQGGFGSIAKEIEIGDTVRIRYLEPENKVVQITISRSEDSPSAGIVHYDKPIARAILGAEEGEEVEVLIGAYVKSARIEKIVAKGTDLK